MYFKNSFALLTGMIELIFGFKKIFGSGHFLMFFQISWIEKKPRAKKIINPSETDGRELHEGLTVSRYGLRGLRLPEVILEANNQNRYCSRHEYLHTEPLTNFLSCLVLSPEVAIVPSIDDSWTKIDFEAA